MTFYITGDLKIQHPAAKLFNMPWKDLDCQNVFQKTPRFQTASGYTLHCAKQQVSLTDNTSRSNNGRPVGINIAFYATHVALADFYEREGHKSRHPVKMEWYVSMHASRLQQCASALKERKGDVGNWCVDVGGHSIKAEPPISQHLTSRAHVHSAQASPTDAQQSRNTAESHWSNKIFSV